MAISRWAPLEYRRSLSMGYYEPALLFGVNTMTNQLIELQKYTQRGIQKAVVFKNQMTGQFP